MMLISNISNLYFIDSSLGQLTIYAITIIFLVALFFVLQGVMRFFMVERDELKRLKANYSKISAEHRRYNNDGKFNQLKQGCDPSLALTRLNNVYLIASQRQKIDQESLSEADYRQDQSTFGNIFIRYAPNIMLFLGLMGTLFGLGELLSGLGSVFSAIDATNTNTTLAETYQVTAHGMGNALSPMKGALMPTFWGVLFSIILSLFLLPYRWVRQSLFAELEVFTNNSLIPIFNPVEQYQELTGLIERVNQNTNIMNSVAGKLDQISSGLSLDFENVNQFSRNLQNAIEIYVKGQELLHTDIVALSEMIRHSEEKNEASGKGSYKILEALNLHNVTIDKLNRKLANTEFNVGDWLKQIITVSKDQQTQFREDIKSILSFTRSNLSSTQSSANRFEMSIRKFDGSLDKMENYLTHFTSALEGSSQSQVQKLEELAQEMRKMITVLSQQRQTVAPQPVPLVITNPATQKYQNPNVDIEKMARKMAQEIAEKKLREELKVREVEYTKLKQELNTLRKREQAARNILKGEENIEEKK